jgi:polar amino acid transport system permease protein
VIPLLIVASLWYLAMTAIVSALQYLLERRVGQSYGRAATQRVRNKPTAPSTNPGKVRDGVGTTSVTAAS